MGAMSRPESPERTIQLAYEAFNARDTDAATAFMHPEVDWPNVLEGSRLRGREAVRGYWKRQFAEIDPRVEPERVIPAADGRFVVEVHQVVRDLAGNLISNGRVRHVHSFRDGLIGRMDVEPG